MMVGVSEAKVSVVKNNVKTSSRIPFMILTGIYEIINLLYSPSNFPLGSMTRGDVNLCLKELKNQKPPFFSPLLLSGCRGYAS
jgi:hypothetical protein